MTAENIAVLWYGTIPKIMHKNKIANGEFTGADRNACKFIPVYFQNIVVAFYQVYCKLRKIISPFQKEVMLFVIIAVKHITYNDYLLWFVDLDLGYQPLHIFFEDGLRHSNSGFSEMARLTKVHIRKDKCFLVFPENAPV